MIYITEPITVTQLIISKIWVDIQPVDDWNGWSYRIYLEDAMSPFFEAYSSPEGCEFETYDMAFDSAIIWLKKNGYINVVERIF